MPRNTELTAIVRRWIAGKIAEILKNDDDVVIELCYNLMEGSRFVRSLFYLAVPC